MDDDGNLILKDWTGINLGSLQLKNHKKKLQMPSKKQQNTLFVLFNVFVAIFYSVFFLLLLRNTHFT